jgi:hypothetical protein
VPPVAGIPPKKPWAVQALWSAEENPETWQLDGNEPLGYMESLQQQNGGLQYSASSDENPVWMTAYAGVSFAGDYLPIPAVPAQEQPPSQPPGSGDQTQTTPSTSGSPAGENGHGGESPQPGGGVIVGGGGKGAPAFSRPQPQSRGHTPGGVRQLSDSRRGAGAAARRDPAPRATTSPASSAPQAKPPASHRSRDEGTAKKGLGTAGKGAGASGGLGQAVAAAGESVAGSASDKVTGVVLGDSLTAFHSVLQAGAPGLRGAGAGGVQSTWLAIALALAAAALALLGAHLERKRPRFTP